MACLALVLVLSLQTASAADYNMFGTDRMLETLNSEPYDALSGVQRGVSI